MGTSTQSHDREAGKAFLRRLRYYLQIGMLSRQQVKTLRGQALGGDLPGAEQGLERLIRGKGMQT